MLGCLGLQCWGLWARGRRRRCGWVLGVLGVGCWGLGVGPTVALRLGAWGAGGAWGGVLGRRWRWADGDDVRTAFAVRGGARRQLCGVCGVCVSRETHVYRVAVGM